METHVQQMCLSPIRRCSCCARGKSTEEEFGTLNSLGIVYELGDKLALFVPYDMQASSPASLRSPCPQHDGLNVTLVSKRLKITLHQLKGRVVLNFASLADTEKRGEIVSHGRIPPQMKRAETNRCLNQGCNARDAALEEGFIL